MILPLEFEEADHSRPVAHPSVPGDPQNVKTRGGARDFVFVLVIALHVHANSAAQGISRFTTCVLQSGVDMPYRAIKTEYRGLAQHHRPDRT
jgi:hypothetical protein